MFFSCFWEIWIHYYENTETKITKITKTRKSIYLSPYLSLYYSIPFATIIPRTKRFAYVFLVIYNKVFSESKMFRLTWWFVLEYFQKKSKVSIKTFKGLKDQFLLGILFWAIANITTQPCFFIFSKRISP